MPALLVATAENVVGLVMFNSYTSASNPSVPASVPARLASEVPLVTAAVARVWPASPGSVYVWAWAEWEIPREAAVSSPAASAFFACFMMSFASCNLN